MLSLGFIFLIVLVVMNVFLKKEAADLVKLTVEESKKQKAEKA